MADLGPPPEVLELLKEWHCSAHARWLVSRANAAPSERLARTSVIGVQDSAREKQDEVQ